MPDVVSNPATGRRLDQCRLTCFRQPPIRRPALVDCALQRLPLLHGTQVYLQQSRGIFSSPTPETSSAYHAIYGNDNYAFNRYVTFNLGIRWDEEQLNAITQSYMFNDNWSPRLGINVDPFGDRKSKVFFNWGRYTQSFPQDGALRDLSNELDVYQANWKPQADAEQQCGSGPMETVVPILDANHLISGDPAAGQQGGNCRASGGASPIFIEHNTKMNFEEEYVGGVERQNKGFVLSARYMDRRLLRIIEDTSGASPEGALSGISRTAIRCGQPKLQNRLFHQRARGSLPRSAAPANCPAGNCPDDNVANYGFDEYLGQPVGGACGYNVLTAADPTPDGKPDGFSNPIPPLPGTGVRGQQELQPQLHVAHELSLGEVIRQLRGSVPQRQWAIGPEHQLTVRLHQWRAWPAGSTISDRDT